MQENCEVALAHEWHRNLAQAGQARALSCHGWVCGFPAAGAVVAPGVCQPLLQGRGVAGSCSVEQ